MVSITCKKYVSLHEYCRQQMPTDLRIFYAITNISEYTDKKIPSADY